MTSPNVNNHSPSTPTEWCCRTEKAFQLGTKGNSVSPTLLLQLKHKTWQQIYCHAIKHPSSLIPGWWRGYLPPTQPFKNQACVALQFLSGWFKFVAHNCLFASKRYFLIIKITLRPASFSFPSPRLLNPFQSRDPKLIAWHIISRRNLKRTGI